MTTFPSNSLATCVNTSMDYDQEPVLDTTFVNNYQDTITSQLSLPLDVDDSVQLKFEVCPSPSPHPSPDPTCEDCFSSGKHPT